VTHARITFLGTGEAFDAQAANTSLLIRTSAKTYLVDCGLTTPHQIWRVNADPNVIDVVYLTHFHADHCFGLPALLLRMKEDGRSKPLPILGQAGVKTFVERLVNLAYPGAYKTLGFPVETIEVSPNRTIRLGAHVLSFHPTRHVVTNLGFRLAINDFSFFVSGDGELTDDSRAALLGSRFAVQECYATQGARPMHATFDDIRAAVQAADTPPERVFLVHPGRDQRAALEAAAHGAGLPFLVPRDLQMYDLD